MIESIAYQIGLWTSIVGVAAGGLLPLMLLILLGVLTIRLVRTKRL